ncbi:MAG TPA: AraC family transcriptional regulator [Capsulimonadaceae bacterium]|nr:AraC family transcriptional regulator [Capsulimonadaceae bacterium]
MANKPNPTVWTKIPERRYKDLFSPTASLNVDKLREIFLHHGLISLASGEPNALILPPQSAYAPKHVAGHKDIHRHRYVEVGIVTRGDMTIWWEGVNSHCPAGSIFVIPPGMRYLPHVHIAGEPSHAHSVVWLALHRGCAIVHMCSFEGDAHHLGEYYSFTDMQVTGQARSMAQELADRAPHYEVAVRGCLLCLLTWLLRAPVYSISRLSGVDWNQKAANQESFSDRVEAYLCSHYHRPLTLAQVSRSIGCSPAYLCRHFKELTGLTPFQYLREVRVEAAKRLLSSEVPIARVAEMVGFDDPLYFSRVFASETGESPQSYRTRCQTEGGKAIS